MAQSLKISYFFLLTLFATLTLTQAEHPIIRARSQVRAFIESECRTTLYRDLCIRSLSYYTQNFTTTPSHQQIAQIALQVSLFKTESTRAYITNIANQLKHKKGVKDLEAIQECLTQINDGFDQLRNCIKETQGIKENGETSDFPWHASNVKTWMSTAVTDATMCMDGFTGRAIGGKTKAMIRAKVLNLQQTTSVSLALFSRFASRYRSSRASKP